MNAPDFNGGLVPAGIFPAGRGVRGGRAAIANGAGREAAPGGGSGGNCVAFSLIEVIFAVAIFAVAITVILGLLPPMLRQMTDSRDAQAAARFGDAIKLEAQRLALTSGFDGLAASIPVMDGTFDTGVLLVASRDSPDVRPIGATDPVPRDQYFLIELRRFPAAPLAYDPAGDFLALSVRISWPYRALTPLGLAGATAARDREQLFLTMVINR